MHAEQTRESGSCSMVVPATQTIGRAAVPRCSAPGAFWTVTGAAHLEHHELDCRGCQLRVQQLGSGAVTEDVLLQSSPLHGTVEWLNTSSGGRQDSWDLITPLE